MIQLGKKYHYYQVVPLEIKKYCEFSIDEKYIVITKLDLEFLTTINLANNAQKIKKKYYENNQKFTKLTNSIVELLFNYLEKGKIVDRIEKQFSIIQIYCLLFEINNNFLNNNYLRMNHFINVLIQKLLINTQIIAQLGWK